MKHSNHRVTGLVVISMLIIYGASAQNLMFRGNSEHASYSSEKPLLNVQLAWKFQTPGAIRGSASIDKEKLIFGATDEFVYCVNKKSGKLIWKYQTEGSVIGTPAIASNVVYISSRDLTLYALSEERGALLWKFSTKTSGAHRWGWDYFISSPTVSNGQVLIGGSDGVLYSLDAKTGKIRWSFKTQGRIRATPAVKESVVYVPSFDGYLYAINTNTGKLHWKFETEGVKLNSDSSGWDRTSIDSSPAIVDSLLVFGSRDGNVYCLNRNSGREKWRFSYGPTWAISSPAIAGNTVFIGWSDNFIFSAIDLLTGKEKWKYTCRYYVYSSPVVSDTVVYVGSHDRALYAFGSKSGKKLWQYRTGGGILSSPVIDEGMLYVGSDDGNLYALERSDKPVLVKAVYGVSAPPRYWTVDPRLAPYLMSFGYQQLDTMSLVSFVEQRLLDGKPSVIVSATERLPHALIKAEKNSLLLRYLQGGGKLVWTGNIPNIHQFNSNGQMIGEDASLAETILHMKFDATHDWGSYPARATSLGKKSGLPDSWIGTFSVPLQQGIEVLGYNDVGRPAAWIKNFGGEQGSGFIMWRGWESYRTARDEELETIRMLAESGF